MTDNVDKTINAVCDWIQKEVKSDSTNIADGVAAEMTKALAELVAARAQCEKAVRLDMLQSFGDTLKRREKSLKDIEISIKNIEVYQKIKKVKKKTVENAE